MGRVAAHFPALHSSAKQLWSFRISLPARRALKQNKIISRIFFFFPEGSKFARAMRQLNGLAPIVDNFLGNSDNFAFFFAMAIFSTRTVSIVYRLDHSSFFLSFHVFYCAQSLRISCPLDFAGTTCPCGECFSLLHSAFFPETTLLDRAPRGSHQGALFSRDASFLKKYILCTVSDKSKYQFIAERLCRHTARQLQCFFI